MIDKEKEWDEIERKFRRKVRWCDAGIITGLSLGIAAIVLLVVGLLLEKI
jgi:hypothetical protein